MKLLGFGVGILLLGLQSALGAELGNEGTTIENLKPIKIIDGDTVTVVSYRNEGEPVTATVRLACIDAPEIKQSYFGGNARSILESLLFETKIKAKIIQKSDKYSRPVVELYTEDGRNINVDLVRQGAAFVFPYYVTNCDSSLYIAAQNAAKARNKGVWSIKGGITRPWDCRRSSTKCRGASSSIARKLLLVA